MYLFWLYDTFGSCVFLLTLYSVFCCKQYVRPGAAPIPGSAPVGPGAAPGQVRPLVNVGPAVGRGRGEWRPTGMKNAPMQKNFHSSFGMSGSGANAGRAFGVGLEFTLPSHK